MTFGGASAYAAQNRMASTLGDRTAADLPDLVAKVQSGVLRIETHTCGGDFIGTGTLLGPRRIATVEHVVHGAVTIRIMRNGQLLATGTVIGSDKDRDVALLRTNKPVTGYRFQFANRQPRVAEEVEVLGYPLGISFTANHGSVSSLHNTIAIDGVQRRELIETDAPTNHGNSGGPMMRVDDGKVVGLVDARTYGEADGISWAVSAKVAQPLLRDWSALPQRVAPVSCDADKALASYVPRIAAILELSASGRGNVGTIVAQVKAGEVTPSKLNRGAAQMQLPITNRQDVLTKIASLPPAPAGATDIPGKLVDAIRASLAADQAYRTWMVHLPNDPAFKTDHAMWQNSKFKHAQTLSGDATRAKAALVELYNPLAQRLGLATWSAAAF